MTSSEIPIQLPRASSPLLKRTLRTRKMLEVIFLGTAGACVLNVIIGLSTHDLVFCLLALPTLFVAAWLARRTARGSRLIRTVWRDGDAAEVAVVTSWRSWSYMHITTVKLRDQTFLVSLASEPEVGSSLQALASSMGVIVVDPRRQSLRLGWVRTARRKQVGRTQARSDD